MVSVFISEDTRVHGQIKLFISKNIQVVTYSEKLTIGME